MANERSRDSLLEFLDYLAEKGLMARATVASRKAAVSKVLGILPVDEASDVTKLDLDQVMTRFHNLHGKGYTPGSLATYRSRLKATIEDFRAYLGNPLGFRPSVQPREKRKSNDKKDQVPAANASAPDNPERHDVKVKAPFSNSILPIPIRADATVYIQGLPFDLTEAEASKIANVIRAMANPI